MVSLPGLAGSVRRSIRYAFVPCFASISGFARFVLIGFMCSVSLLFFWHLLSPFVFSLGWVLSDCFYWVRISSVLLIFHGRCSAFRFFGFGLFAFCSFCVLGSGLLV